MTNLAEERNRIAAKLIGGPTTKSKKTTKDPKGRTPLKFNKILSNLAKMASALTRVAAGSTSKMLVTTRSRVTTKATKKVLSDSKNQTLVGFAKLMKWLRTPLAAHPEYVKFKEWLRTPLTPRSLLPVAA